MFQYALFPAYNSAGIGTAKSNVTQIHSLTAYSREYFTLYSFHYDSMCFVSLRSEYCDMNVLYFSIKPRAQTLA